jgi:para-nitrobenzyl esterase
MGLIRTRLLLACAWLGLLAAPAMAADMARAPTPQARTAQGEVVGRLHEGVAAYLGIPYAAPPVGPLRFRPPAAPAAWAAPREAENYGSPCPQTARLGSASTDEDCLFLNVWAPLGARARPVMVFIHGGSFNSGSGGVTTANPNGPGPSYDGSDLARAGEAVVVTLNYRLGVLGFLTAPALDAESEAHVSGNYGLLDQLAALRWVAANIAAFGGDPRHVTVFGESAGGISVLDLLASPAAAGLFQRAIVESANDGRSPSLLMAEAQHAKIVEALGCDQAAPAEVAACLRAAPVARLLGQAGGGPVIDGATLPEPPLTAFRDGRFNRVPVIVGTNADEGSYFLTVAERGAGRALTAEDRTAIEGHAFGAKGRAVAAAYPAEQFASAGAALAAIVTDSFFACPSEAVRLALGAYVPVLGYEFRQPAPVRNFPLPGSPVSPPDIPLGDAHTTELGYVFGHDGTGAALHGADAQLAARVLALWTGRETAAQGFVDLAEPAVPGRDFAQAHRCGFWQSVGSPQALIVSVPKG